MISLPHLRILHFSYFFQFLLFPFCFHFPIISGGYPFRFIIILFLVIFFCARSYIYTIATITTLKLTSSMFLFRYAVRFGELGPDR